MHNPYMLAVLLAAVVLLFLAVFTRGFRAARIQAGQNAAASTILLVLMTVSGFGCALAVAFDMGLINSMP